MTTEQGRWVGSPDVLKIAVCECLIAINDDLDPVSRDKWGPIIPPTAINWIGDRLVQAIRDPERRPMTDRPTLEET